MSARNLPSQPTVFVGRQEEQAAISQLLANPACRLLTLIGPGGMGKTRLALHVAESVAETYPEGVYFVPLQPLTSPDLILSTIAEAIGYQFASSGNPGAQLLDWLHSRRLLLVLDNFEHLLDRATLLSRLLSTANGLQLLVTSRERLNLVEEWVLEIGGLDYPLEDKPDSPTHFSAVELFMLRAQRANVRFNPQNGQRPMVSRICRLLGGMPLAIELAANWVRALPCEAIAEEIERSLDILETSSRSIEPRHRTMRAAFEPTWERLSDLERDVFMRLAVFRGGFTREAADHIANASLRVLSALVDKSLLRVNADARYDLHELLRQYAAEKLQSSGQTDTTRDAYSAYYADFLRRMWTPLRTARQAETLDEIEPEFDNIRNAWGWMVEQRRTEELSRSIYCLWYFCDLRCRHYEALRLLVQAEDMLRPFAGDNAVDRVIGQILGRRGFFVNELGKSQEARPIIEESLALVRRAGSPEDVAMALDSLALNNIFLNDADALEPVVDEALAVARKLNDPWLLARSLFWPACLQNMRVQHEMARIFSLDCLKQANLCGDMYLKAQVYFSLLGYIARQRSEYAQAQEYYEQGCQLFESVGQSFTAAESCQMLGEIALRLNEYPQAAAQFRKCLLKLDGVYGFTHLLMRSLVCIADLQAAQHQPGAAVELLTVILQHPENLETAVREQAKHRLDRLRSQLAPAAFAEAEARGTTLTLEAEVKGLLAALSAGEPTTPLAAHGPVSKLLTGRELDILRLLAEGMSNREIAGELFLAISTVKWYIGEILRKLEAANRTQAVSRARALGLLV
jgi:predicted ATPase/DNA-binding NarL/FixJ family response regulator